MFDIIWVKNILSLNIKWHYCLIMLILIRDGLKGYIRSGMKLLSAQGWWESGAWVSPVADNPGSTSPHTY